MTKKINRRDILKSSSIAVATSIYSQAASAKGSQRKKGSGEVTNWEDDIYIYNNSQNKGNVQIKIYKEEGESEMVYSETHSLQGFNNKDMEEKGEPKKATNIKKLDKGIYYLVVSFNGRFEDKSKIMMGERGHPKYMKVVVSIESEEYVESENVLKVRHIAG